MRADVFVVDDTIIKFKIPDAALRARVLRRGIPMIVSKLSPISEETQPEIKFIPIWVVFRNVP